MKAEEWVALMLEEANMMAYFYKKWMASASTQQLYESMEDPNKSRVILYLTQLLS